MNKLVYSLIIFLIILFSCNGNIKSGCIHREIDTKRIERSNDEKLHNYFSGRTIEPKIIINNVSGHENHIEIGNHKLRWEDGAHPKFFVDGEEIALEKVITENAVHNLQKDSLVLATNWKEVRVYEYKNNEVLAITLNYQYCSGCNGRFYLLYDTEKRANSYFGSMETEPMLGLFNFGDDKSSFVSVSHLNNPECQQRVYNLYTLGMDGIFKLRNKPNGDSYEINQYYTPEGFKKYENLYVDWIEKIE